VATSQPPAERLPAAGLGETTRGTARAGDARGKQRARPSALLARPAAEASTAGKRTKTQFRSRQGAPHIYMPGWWVNRAGGRAVTQGKNEPGRAARPVPLRWSSPSTPVSDGLRRRGGLVLKKACRSDLSKWTPDSLPTRAHPHDSCFLPLSRHYCF
jgi:hypothetical protein